MLFSGEGEIGGLCQGKAPAFHVRGYRFSGFAGSFGERVDHWRLGSLSLERERGECTMESVLESRTRRHVVVVVVERIRWNTR